MGWRVTPAAQNAKPNSQGGVGNTVLSLDNPGTIMDKNMQVALGTTSQLEDLKKKKKKYQTIMDVLLGGASGTPSTAMGV